MKVNYRGLEIEITGSKKEGFQYIVMRLSDYWLLGCGYYGEGIFKNAKECLEDVMILVEDYYEYPENYED